MKKSDFCTNAVAHSGRKIFMAAKRPEKNFGTIAP